MLKILHQDKYILIYYNKQSHYINQIQHMTLLLRNHSYIHKLLQKIIILNLQIIF
jgi:hypothetical protein